jgi:hypothetical protein
MILGEGVKRTFAFFTPPSTPKKPCQIQYHALQYALELMA